VSEFRDAIAEAAQVGTAALYVDQAGGKVADEILAMPEMQAIRRTLAVYGQVESALSKDSRVKMNPRLWLSGVCGIPESVVAWILEDDDDQ
jgi:hypothetical protein